MVISLSSLLSRVVLGRRCLSWCIWIFLAVMIFSRLKRQNLPALQRRCDVSRIKLVLKCLSNVHCVCLANTCYFTMLIFSFGVNPSNLFQNCSYKGIRSRKWHIGNCNCLDIYVEWMTVERSTIAGQRHSVFWLSICRCPSVRPVSVC